MLSKTESIHMIYSDMLNKIKMEYKMNKEKPTYSTIQNTSYLLKNTWITDKRVILTIIAQMILAVAISTVWIFLPATVVERI